MAKVRRVPGPAADRFKVAMAELAKDKVAKVGWFESAVYENGTPVALVAAVHEFGAPSKNIPPRPFFRPTIAREEGAWRDLARRGAKAILNGTTTAQNALEALGGKAAGDVAKTIASITSPPLKPATINAKRRRRADKKTVGGLSKPLVDTGLMISSLTHTVEDK